MTPISLSIHPMPWNLAWSWSQFSFVRAYCCLRVQLLKSTAAFLWYQFIICFIYLGTVCVCKQMLLIVSICCYINKYNVLFRIFLLSFRIVQSPYIVGARSFENANWVPRAFMRHLWPFSAQVFATRTSSSCKSVRRMRGPYNITFSLERNHTCLNFAFFACFCTEYKVFGVRWRW